MPITLNGSVSGQVTVEAPAVAGTTSITLPAVSGGEFVVSNSSGNVGIGNSNPTYKLTIGNDPTGILGTTAGDTVDFTRLYAVDNNNDYLDFKINRNSNGSDWTSASWSIQRTVDVTPMGYISLGSFSSDLITFGKGTTEYFRIGALGQIGLSGANYGTSGQVLTSNGSGAAPSWSTISGYSDADALSLLNASGSAPVYACRAWVNFNGTGTVAIRASGNVSSITDQGTGNYRVNFSTAMPDANYAAIWRTGDQSPVGTTGTFLSTSVQVLYGYDGVNYDNDRISVGVFR